MEIFALRPATESTNKSFTFEGNFLATYNTSIRYFVDSSHVYFIFGASLTQIFSFTRSQAAIDKQYRKKSIVKCKTEIERDRVWIQLRQTFSTQLYKGEFVK